MKIFENNFDTEVGRYLYTNNPFKLLKQIVSENQDVVVLSPFTKVSEVINFNKNGGLMQNLTLNNINVDALMQIKSLNQICESINQELGVDLLILNLDQQKLLKNVFELSNEYISDKNINTILEFINKFAIKLPAIAIVGFDEIKVTKNIPHLEILLSFKNKINYANLEGLLIDCDNDIFEVHDFEAFLGWLELKTKTVITHEMINNFLNGKVDISSYLINNALKEIK